MNAFIKVLTRPGNKFAGIIVHGPESENLPP